MSQFHPTQHAGDNDYQMWQQQMMFKQLQEFQRQQQLQQSDHGARMQPSFGQFHAPAKSLPADQLSTMSNEMAINEAMNSAWPHNFTGGDPSLTSNSQMLNNGSTNWDQIVGAPGVGNFMNGSMFLNAQNQSMRPMGLATHQVDQSFYPMHAASSRGPGNQYSQFLGIPADPQSAVARVGPDQSEKASRPFNSSMNEHGLHLQGNTRLMHNFRGKGGFLNNSLMQSQGDNIRAGSPVTMNQLQHGFQTQDFHGRSNQVDLQAGMQEKSAMQVGQASGGASLDPTEEKILFGSDEDSNWGALLRGENDNSSSLDNDNYGGGYSSLQNGSWSALMQEALQSTTSENSPKEEWSGLSFHKTEQVVANNANLPGRNENNLIGLSGANLENARPSPMSSYADGTMNNSNIASFQHAIRPQFERMNQRAHESPNAHVNNHQSTSEVNNGYFNQSLKQIQSDGRQEIAHLPNGIWGHQKPEPLRNNLQSTAAHATPPGAHGFWMSQQNTTDHNINRGPSNNQNDRKASNAFGQDAHNSPNVFNSNENSWKSTGGNANSVQRHQQRKSDVSTTNESSDGKNISMMSSTMPMMTQDHYQMITGRSGEQIGMNRNMAHRVPETSESPRKSAEQRLGDSNQEYLNATPNERQTHILSHGQHITSDSAPRRHSVFAGKESENIGQSGQQAMGSYMLQNRAIGSSGMNIGPSPGNPVSNSLFPPHSHQMRNNLQHHFGTNSHVSNNMPSASEKMMMAQELLQSRHGLPNSSSALPFGGADTGLSQNRTVQNSQHMLQLLHKVDNSRNSNVVADIPNNTVGVVSAQQQLNHPSLQGFGLRLAPPSQRQSNSGNLWSSQTNIDGKQSDNSAQDDDRTQLPSTPSQSLTPQNQNSQSSPFHSSETENTGQPIERFPQLSSDQQYPVADERSVPAPMLQQPQQSNSATVFKNVWTNISAQRLAGMQANKITPNILQSMMFPNNAAASNLWSSQKADDQGQRAATPSDIATSSANSQNQDSKQAADSDAGLASSQKANLESTGATVPTGNESLQKPSSDGNPINAVSSFAQLRQQGILGVKHVENPGANFQAMNASQNNANNSGGIVLHGSPAPSNIQQQNYSLLHQMQALRHTDIDPGSLVGKTTRSDIGSDASQIDWKSGQRFAHVANNSTKSSADNIGSPGVPGSFPPDMKMLSFASRSEERNPNIPSQLPSGERPSSGMVTTQNDNQNQVQPMGTSATSNSVERSDRPRISPQMAPSWFGHYGNYRNGQSVAMLNAQKPTALPYNFPKASWNNENNNSAENRVESGQSVRPGHHLPSTRMEALVPSNVKVSSMMRRPKKRKSMDSTFVSWHKIIESPQKLSISTSEMDWAWTANRLIEKDEAETLDDAPPNYLPRKRLILTTQLIQQLLPAIPAAILRTKAASAYESVTYTLSMQTLRDACSMASSSSYNSCTLMDDENNPSEQTTSAKKMENKVSKAVEVFVGRIRKMENDFVSLNKRASMLDVQLECQDLERISIVNRLGRFHGRNHAAAAEGSSGSEMTRRIFPERHVMSFAVPGNLPEGVYCLSL